MKKQDKLKCPICNFSYHDDRHNNGAFDSTDQFWCYNHDWDDYQKVGDDWVYLDKDDIDY